MVKLIENEFKYQSLGAVVSEFCVYDDDKKEGSIKTFTKMKAFFKKKGDQENAEMISELIKILHKHGPYEAIVPIEELEKKYDKTLDDLIFDYEYEDDRVVRNFLYELLKNMEGEYTFTFIPECEMYIIFEF